MTNKATDAILIIEREEKKMKNNALEELKVWADKYDISYNSWESSWKNGWICFTISDSNDVLLFSKEGNFLGIE